MLLCHGPEDTCASSFLVSLGWCWILYVEHASHIGSSITPHPFSAHSPAHSSVCLHLHFSCRFHPSIFSPLGLTTPPPLCTDIRKTSLYYKLQTPPWSLIISPKVFSGIKAHCSQPYSHDSASAVFSFFFLRPFLLIAFLLPVSPWCSAFSSADADRRNCLYLNALLKHRGTRTVLCTSQQLVLNFWALLRLNVNVHKYIIFHNSVQCPFLLRCKPF